jgi:uncharacterized membrane protein YhhN
LDLSSVLIALSLAAITSTVLTIVVRYALPQPHALFYIFKPLTTCLILAAALIPATHAQSSYGAAIALGLIFSLAGDIWLMLPGDRFLPGLASFLLAHLSYCFAFASADRFADFPWPALVPTAVGALVLWYLWPALPSKLRPPVSAYVLVMVAMASLAGYRASSDPSIGALSAAIGALLFLASDAGLAVNRFRRPFRSAHVIVLGTYYAGQLLIALSVGLLVAPAA